MSTFQTHGPNHNADAIRLFESLANLTWGWLRDARRLNLGFSEDTISDLAMLEIARTVPKEVGVFRVSKRDERLVGFDWLWVISGPGLPPTFYVVQAKKLKLDQTSTYSYGRLRYLAGSTYQIDALEDFADWIGAIPLYCFYNHVEEQTAVSHWNCRIQQPPDPTQMGCTVAPLDVVRPVHDGKGPKRFDSIHWHPDAVPWRCLFHPSCTQVGVHNQSGRRQEERVRTGRIGALEFLSSLTPRSGRQVDDNRLVDDDYLIDDERSIDMQELIGRLNMEGLVERYATQRFVPIPDRIITLNLGG